MRHVVTKPPPKKRPRPKPPAIKRLKLPSTPRTGTVSLPILMYHRIDDLDPSLPGVTLRLSPTDST